MNTETGKNKEEDNGLRTKGKWEQQIAPWGLICQTENSDDVIEEDFQGCKPPGSLNDVDKFLFVVIGQPFLYPYFDNLSSYQGYTTNFYGLSPRYVLSVKLDIHRIQAPVLPSQPDSITSAIGVT